ncbi:hypothetical protein JOQ06_019663 [Pogonophryne albipinna]|uniref:Uncharacterized protein n=1 Tax=Pogonophryne albipinna TaxID=1090488 RepID=A0AAD6FVU1_9TELE|nr:hypothetical protein JOQ06_019663 [Pogonophryne albipinna]
MAAGTPAFHKLETILSTKRILKAVAKLSPHHQTSSLESFHAVIPCRHPALCSKECCVSISWNVVQVK